jgi:hypothetical protein
LGRAILSNLSIFVQRRTISAAIINFCNRSYGAQKLSIEVMVEEIAAARKP